MKKAYALAIATLAISAGAAAAAITVNQRTDTINIFAERIDLQQHVVLGATSILPAAGDAAAAGTSALPVEMTTALAAARTALTRDHWTYTVEVREAAGGSLSSGMLAVTLLVDNALSGTVYLEQAAADAGQVEGARVTFDVGTALQPSSLYYVEVKPFTPNGPTVAFTVRSIAGPKWEGVGGTIAGVENPALSLPLGSTLRLTAVNADGGFHDIGVRDSAGNVVSPPGWSADIDATGEEVILAWTPSSAGTYSYACKYHVSTMAGTLTVTS